MNEQFAPPTGHVVGADDFLTDGTRAVLRISRCRSCGSGWFPARVQCAECASKDVTAEVTSHRGTAYASTVVRVGPARFRPPYVLSYVDVDGVRVLAHADTDTALAPGTPVELRLAEIGADDNGPLLSYAVTSTQGEMK